MIIKYNVQRFDESTVEVSKLQQEDYYRVAECGARTLFDFGEYRFLDCNDAQDNEHYLILDFNNNGDSNEPNYYELSLKHFHDLVALYLVHQQNATNVYDVLLEEIIAVTTYIKPV